MTSPQTEGGRKVPSDAKIVLCGAGNICRQVLDKYPEMLEQEGQLCIAAVCDNDMGKHMSKLRYGLQVRNPEAIAEIYRDTEAVFVILIHIGADAMQRQLEGCGIPPERILHWWTLWMHFDALRVPEWCDAPPPPEGWLDVWNDEASKQVIRDAHAFYQAYSDRSADYKPGAAHSPSENIYFDETIYRPLIDERFLDCGAFDGDTMMDFRKRYDMYQADILCVEANQDNFKALTAKQSKLIPEGTRHWCALVGDPDVETVCFAGSGVNGKVSDEGDVVPASTIDKLCQYWITSLIKMDIEGSELDALKGAVATIKRDRPVLTICLYHKATDIWEIPAFLASVCEDYVFRARNYDGLFEVVMYAVPRERCIC